MLNVVKQFHWLFHSFYLHRINQAHFIEDCLVDHQGSCWQADQVYQETFKLRGEQEAMKRRILNLSNVDHSIDGLQQLIVSRLPQYTGSLDYSM